MREVNADEFYDMLIRRFGDKAEADRICPTRPAEQEPAAYDYHADWERHPDPSGNNDVHWTCRYCDAPRNSRPTARHDCPDHKPADHVAEGKHRQARGVPTDQELRAVWDNEEQEAPEEFTIEDGLRAVANLASERAGGVVVTHGEVGSLVLEMGGKPTDQTIIKRWLRSKGVNVTEGGK